MICTPVLYSSLDYLVLLNIEDLVQGCTVLHMQYVLHCVYKQIILSNQRTIVDLVTHARVWSQHERHRMVGDSLLFTGTWSGWSGGRPMFRGQQLIRGPTTDQSGAGNWEGSLQGLSLDQTWLPGQLVDVLPNVCNLHRFCVRLIELNLGNISN